MRAWGVPDPHVAQKVRISMKKTVLWRAALLVTIALAASGRGLAGSEGPEGHRGLRQFRGVIDDYEEISATNAMVWHIWGSWSLRVKGDSGKAEFSAALAMIHPDDTPRGAHTHHVTLSDGEVTPIPNGIRISGTAVITGNGNLAGFSGSPIQVDLTGGTSVQFSNVAVTFGDPATAHFGDQPFHGVVTSWR
jgi:hypothetical protein